MKAKITPTGHEIVLHDEDVIVSKTDLTGRITYANRTFMRIADYCESELLGKQHNIVRHPDMPRGAFKLCWDTIKSGHEFFAYVKNLTSEGHHYWVFANITPDRDSRGELVGYFSVRRKAGPKGVAAIESLYREMLDTEREAGPAKAPEASLALVAAKLKSLGTTYDRFILNLRSDD